MALQITKINEIDWTICKPKFPIGCLSEVTILEPFGLRKPEKFIEFDKNNVKIGIVADIHQNTLVLSDILDNFKALGVDVILAAGDYSYIPEHLGKKDPKNIRFVQFKKAMEHFEKWLVDSKKNDARLALIMGNHEVDPDYFEGGYSSNSYRQIHKYAMEMSRNRSIIMPDDPFLSYDVSNSLHLNISFSSNRRSFRLAHAISDTFVTALYRGLYPNTNVARRALMLEKLEKSIGKVWRKSLDENFEKATNLWAKFQSNDTMRKQEIALLISENIRNAMNFNKLIQVLASSAHEYTDFAGQYLANYRNINTGDYNEEYIWKFYNPLDYESTPFAHDIFRINWALGIGRMYSICGHFHTDLGVFKASEEFGTHVVGVGGLQPKKRIYGEFTAYLLECTDRKDTVYRISADDTLDDDFDYDMSRNEWS